MYSKNLFLIIGSLEVMHEIIWTIRSVIQLIQFDLDLI